MFARTERLLLRPAWQEDAPALFHAIADEGIVRNLAKAPWPYRLEDAEAFVSRPGEAAHPALLIFRRASEGPTLIGAIGLGTAESGATELGYWIARPHWGCGYATEAGRALIAVARHSLRLDKLLAGHFLDNPASGRVLRKLGFTPTGAIGSRHSVGRGEAVPCAEFVLDLGPLSGAGEELDACDMMAA